MIDLLDKTAQSSIMYSKVYYESSRERWGEVSAYCRKREDTSSQVSPSSSCFVFCVRIIRYSWV